MNLLESLKKKHIGNWGVLIYSDTETKMMEYISTLEIKLQKA